MIESAGFIIWQALIGHWTAFMKLHEMPGALWRAHQLRQLDIEMLHAESGDEVPVVVSFTSIPSRFHVIHLTVRSVLSGTSRPEKVVLWLHESLKNQVPASLTCLLGRRFEIRYAVIDCPHLKLVESLQAFPEKLIVTCDDDLMYDGEWLGALYKEHLRHPTEIVANECRAIAYDESGEVRPYRYWYREGKKGATYDALLPLGFGGVLYPPGCLHPDVINTELYLQLTPKADDLWFKAMSYLQGTASRRSSISVGKPIHIPDSQAVNLKSGNVKQDGNRLQWQALSSHYSLPAFLPFVVNKEPSPVKIDHSTTSPIDAVITWVDGADPKHAEKLETYLAEIGREKPKAALATRFNDAGELGYCIASLLKFAPWLRTIYIVTDAQVPKAMQWLAQTPYANKVQLVDHKDIFAGNESCLPTFNTRSITSLLYRIPGLAERFIFLNDDFILIRPVQPQDFFRESNIVLRGKWHLMLWDRLMALSGNDETAEAGNGKDLRAKYLISQKLAARLAGFRNRYFQLRHDPHPMQVSALNRFFTGAPELLAKNIRYKLRSRSQFTVESLAAHLALHDGSAVIDNNLDTLQVKPASQGRLRIKLKLKAADRNRAMAFVCVQSMDRASPRVRDMVFSWLLKRIGTLDNPAE